MAYENVQYRVCFIRPQYKFYQRCSDQFKGYRNIEELIINNYVFLKKG